MRSGFQWRKLGWQAARLSVVLLLASCATSAPVHYYQLSSQRGVVPVLPVPSGFETLEIGIGPVTLPTYLDRPQLATRLSANQLFFADQHRWAEPLADNFSRVLSENLSQLLGTDRFQIFPWPRSRSIDWQFIVEVLRLENKADGSAVLEVRWSIWNGAGEVMLPARHSHFKSPATGPNQTDRVAGLSKTVADLCQEIVTEFVSLNAPNHSSRANIFSD